MTEQSWVPAGLDVDQPSTARIYDYLLGGGHNFAADRALGEQLIAVLPKVQDEARLNRAFLRRVVLSLMSAGVRQFLDLGSGIPTVGNVHEVAQQVDEQARVVYVDREAIAAAHSHLLLEGNERATLIQADLREPDTILEAAETRRLLDFDEPIGLLMLSVLHIVSDEQRPGDIVAAYRDRLPTGSYLALSHGTADFRPEEVARIVEVFKHGSEQIYPRTREEITALFAGFDLVEPGLVSPARWRPDSPEELGAGAELSEVYYAGVGRKP
ncbi:MAG: SAM-dependent methyltransferase [Actinomycetota bacterium]|nr:SAM-dependent methyltransferase [Actinomycetota bacterium]